MPVGGLGNHRKGPARKKLPRVVAPAIVGLALVWPGAARAETITFEDLTPHPPPPGGAGQPVNIQYTNLGVTFNNPSAFDYGSGFAHSGTVAVEPCVGQEFC